MVFFFFSSRRRHTICALVTGVQTCALPIFFKPDLPPFRLTTLDQRQRLFAEAGADAMLVFHFDAALASVTAEDFVTEHLIGLIGAAGVATGEDFTFGHRRGGNVEVLKRLGAEHGLSVDAVAAIEADGEPVSSSRIREALEAGDWRSEGHTSELQSLMRIS